MRLVPFLSRTLLTIGATIDWNPITWESAAEPGNPSNTYRGSKTFAEKAAWDFVRDEKPNFELTTVCPCVLVSCYAFKHASHKD